MMAAIGITIQEGKTLEGWLTKRPEMTTANTALTIRRSRKMTIMKTLRARGPITTSVSAPIDFALFRWLAQSAPASCTPAKKTVPRTTQRKAGNQPQITAMAGPTIGAAPATEVKWWPQSTYLLVGT